MNNFDYETNLKLHHNELPAKVNSDTGEVSIINSNKKNNIPFGKEIFEKEALFKKNYNKSWQYLYKVLSPLELRVALKLSMMVEMNTNSLKPLNDSTAINDLAIELDISRNKVSPILKRLFSLGVYGKFEVARVNEPHTKYWILNPYLTFSGRTINTDIIKLFKGTAIEIVFNEKD